MDAFNYDNYTEDFARNYGDTRKEMAILRENFRKVVRNFQLLERALAVILVSWLLFRFKISVVIFVELLRQLLGLIRSPLVIFVLCSVVYFAFMIKSYRSSAKNIADDNVGNNIYESIIDMIQFEFQGLVQFEEVGAPCDVQYRESMALSEEIDEAVYEDKEIVCVVTSTSTPACEVGDDVETDSDADLRGPRVNRRIQSENLESERELAVNLQYRSEAKTFESMDPKGVLSENSFPTDELNDEQFKETIDAFIKKQRQFRSHEIHHDYYEEGHKSVSVTIN